MCLEWCATHTDGVIVLHILPLDSTADYLARWEQSQENTSLGVAGNGYLSVLYVVVQCLEMESCKDALRPGSLLGSVSSCCVTDQEARPRRSAAVQCTGDPAVRKLSIRASNPGWGAVINAIKHGSLFEERVHGHFFIYVCRLKN